ncbi:MAG: NUDIX domain-containing protein [Armatimonadetes bacterium]|nr:NUDIX domain-containing protein [Armatimonadota bacterium]
MDDHNLHTLGVGGWVVRSDGAVLLVRMTYGPANGRLMMPGGHADPDELLGQTAVREVREETGVTAEPRGILMVRQRLEGDGRRNLYIVFLMTPLDGEARADEAEVSEALWLTPQEILARDDVQPIARELASAWASSPQACLARRSLTWQDDSVYQLWAGESTAQPGAPQAPKSPPA